MNSSCSCRSDVADHVRPAGYLRQTIEQRVGLDADRVDHDARAAGGVDDRVLGQPARRVMAVGEQEHQRPRAVARLELEREVDRIAQRRRAAPRHRAERRPDRLEIAGHRHAQVHHVREGDQRGAIVRPQGGGQPFAGLDEMAQPIAGDALARVEHEGDAERQLLQRDALDILRHTVVGQREIAGGQARDRRAAAHHRDVELDDFHAAAERRLRRRRHGLRGEEAPR